MDKAKAFSNRWLTLIIIGIWGIFDLGGSTAQWYYPVLSFSREQYNGSTQNWEIEEHPNGLIYVANNHGVLEYDGYNWLRYSVNNGSNVYSLALTADRIYAGAYREFGYFTPDKQGILHYHSLSDQLQPGDRKFDIIFQIHRVGTQQLYFVTDKNLLFYYNGQTVEALKAPANIMSSFLANNYIYLVTKQGIYCCSNRKFELLPNTKLLHGVEIGGIGVDQSSNLTIITQKQGIYHYKNRVLSKWNTEADVYLKDNIVYSVAFTDSLIAMGTVKSGVILLNRSGKKPRIINSQSGLQNNTVLSLTFSRHHHLWLGLDGGIDVLQLNSPLTNLYGTKNDFGAGYASIINKDVLYLGTNQGLFSTPWPVENSGKSIPTAYPVSNIAGQVWALQEINKEIFCCHIEGVSMIKGHTAHSVAKLKGAWKLMPWDANTILVGTFEGFSVLKRANGNWSLSHHIPDFKESSRIMEWDSDGSLWMSHGNIGVYKVLFDSALHNIQNIELYGASKGLPINFNNSVFKYNGEILFTTTKGMYRYNNQNDSIEPYSDLNSQMQGQQFYTKVDFSLRNTVIYTTSEALGVRSNNDTWEYGLLTNRLIGGFESIYVISDHQAVIGHEKGFSLLDFKPQPDSYTDSRVYFRSLRAIQPKDSLIYRWSVAGVSPSISLPYQMNSIQIESICSNTVPNKQILYSFKLSNQDSWSPWSTNNMQNFVGLSEGDHIIQVRIRNYGSERVLSECEFSLTILPPWYRSVAAYIVYIILLIATLYSWLIWTNKRIEQKSTAIIYKKDLEINELQNQKLESELKLKSQQLASSTMNLIQKNETLLHIKDLIIKIYSEITDKSESLIKRRLLEIQGIINENIAVDNDWKKFEENFDFVHSNFLERLQREFPSLTVSEKKMCAYLKMNLSSKEIAPLMNISVRGVEISRYRLRKKLNLHRDINLVEFLHNY